MALYRTAELFVEMEVINTVTECVAEAQKVMRGYFDNKSSLISYFSFRKRKQVLFIKGNLTHFRPFALLFA